MHEALSPAAEAILAKIVELNMLIQASPPGADMEACWAIESEYQDFRRRQQNNPGLEENERVAASWIAHALLS